ncbi:MAG: hypothetical protein ACYTCU_00980 [Planctomycetota bacterium]
MGRHLLFALLLAFPAACGGDTDPATTTAASQTDAGPKCDLCKKVIPEGKGVAATVGDEDRDYRCIHCALTDIQDDPADVEIRATTPVDGADIRLTRAAGAWSSSPEATVFLILPERADECLDLHQPFADKDEFDRYLAAHPEVAAEGPVAYTIAQYEEIVVAGMPR